MFLTHACKGSVFHEHKTSQGSTSSSSSKQLLQGTPAAAVRLNGSIRQHNCVKQHRRKRGMPPQHVWPPSPAPACMPFQCSALFGPSAAAPFFSRCFATNTESIIAVSAFCRQRLHCTALTKPQPRLDLSDSRQCDSDPSTINKTAYIASKQNHSSSFTHKQCPI